MAYKIYFGWTQAWLSLVMILFFAGTLVLVNPARLYVSPDETANAFTAITFADSLSMRGAVDNLQLEFDRLHPRSLAVDNGRLVPGSFLGLPFLYGFFVMIFGSMSLWLLTPLITILAAHGFRRVIEKVVSVPIGTLTFALFLLHPAIWYYSARGLMHNVLFMDLLVLGAWTWICRPMRAHKKRPSVWNDLLAGLFIGLALFVRVSEFVWVMGGLVAAGFIWWRSLSWRRARAALVGFIVGIGLLLIMNYLTYGDPFTTGYTIGAPPVTELLLNDSIDTVAVLPFGIHLKSAWQHFDAYAITMFWWLSIPALFGFFLLLARKVHRRAIRWSIVLAAAVSIWLVVMYGSWEIHDNPDPTQITMANSYVRYWLPMYLFSIPMIAATIQRIASRGRSMVARGLIIATLLLLIIVLNVNAAFIQGQDGLLKMRDELAKSALIQESVLRYTEANSVIIVDRGDKLFFPRRHVWYPLRDGFTYNSMPSILEATTLYYYGITFPQEDIDYLNDSRLGRMGLGIESIQTYGEESLYRIFEL